LEFNAVSSFVATKFKEGLEGEHDLGEVIELEISD
jgi:hypothetical protein